MPPESLHVTLAFLGWIEEDRVAAVAEVLEPPAVGELRLGRALLLPPRRPRVMAVELDDPSGDCRRCQAAVAAAMAAAGFYEPEDRPWLPHVTIGRTRERVNRATMAAVRVPELSFTPPSVTLYRSHLEAAGARYEAVRRVGV